MKALFFDIDGTLVDAARGVDEIPPSVVHELERLRDAGHKLVICSGRPLAMIDARFRIPLFDAYVLCNGAHVVAEGQTIFADTLNPAVAKALADLLEELDCDYMLEDDSDHIYLDRRFTELFDFFEPYAEPGLFLRDFDRDEVLRHTIKNEANVTNRDRDRVLASLDESMGCVVVADQHGSDNAFELYSATTSKSTGIEKVLAHFGARRQDTYGFGDGSNDLDMIKYCAVGVAMGNAVPALKEVANLACGNVEDDGLADVLRTID